jgi:hypothetical protein
MIWHLAILNDAMVFRATAGSLWSLGSSLILGIKTALKEVIHEASLENPLLRLFNLQEGRLVVVSGR